MKYRILFYVMVLLIASCNPQAAPEKQVRLITLDPGHFHAALVQKSMYDDVDSNVYVYAPAGGDLDDHLARIKGYNQRAESPTRWNQHVYTGNDFLQKMLTEKKGNVVVLAGNNRKKTEYIKASLESGYNVLSDKPMAIDHAGFEKLLESFEFAETKGLLLYDIMTERSEITTLFQREFSMDKGVFGELEKGSPEEPAITKESVHHFFKTVSGSVLKRPAWFFDVEQQGEGITDVTTHLVDLVQWECFPEQIIDYTKDIKIDSSRRWPTAITATRFNEITTLNSWPDYLQKYLSDSILNVYCNGTINYRIKDIHARVSVIWNYRAPEGAGDTHFSIMRGSKANLVIRQGKEQNYKPVLSIEPKVPTEEIYDALYNRLNIIQNDYPGVRFKEVGKNWEVVIPDKYRIGHEEHFAQVMERFLEYLKTGEMPAWEIPNMKAKYYTTTQALEMARSK